MGDATVPAGLRVLLVEDNSVLAGMASELLESIGCAVVHSAASAEDAMEWLSAGGELDLLLTDIVMPGMNGVELACHVRERHPDMPVLLMTGYGDALLDEQQRHFPVVSKPYSGADMSRAISGAIRARVD